MDQNGFADFQKQEKEGWSCLEEVLLMIQIVLMIWKKNLDNHFA